MRAFCLHGMLLSASISKGLHAEVVENCSVKTLHRALTCLLLVQEKEEFSENIIQDVAALGITYEKLTHTSDYFPEMLDLAERLIKKGYIYADDTPLEQMREVYVVSA